MPAFIAQCPCGARYKVDAAVIGRRVKCKKCGDAFEVRAQAQPAPAQPAPRTPVPKENSATPAPAARAFPLPPPAAVAVAAPTNSLGYAVSDGASPAPRGAFGFLHVLLNSFLFFRRFGNIKTFFVAWIVLAGGDIGSGLLFALGSVHIGALGFLVFFLAEGSFAAFSFDTIRQAAEGEDELPAYPLTAGPEDWWGLLIKPFFAYVSVCLLVLAPAFIYSVAINAIVSEDSAINPVSQLLGAGGLAALGLFLWPMLILCLTIGSSGKLLRVDRIVPAIIRTFGPYTGTVLTVYLSAAAYVCMRIFLDQGNLPGIILTVVAYGVRVFLQIAAMRAVGGYYHRHYQDLAWMLD